MAYRILIAGHSHVFALRRAILADKVENVVAVNLDKDELLVALRDDDRVRLQALYGRIDVLCLTMSGNFHNVIGLFNHPQPFYLVPGEPYGQMIPLALMRQLFSLQHKKFLTLAHRISGFLAPRHCIVIAPPPPVADAERIGRNATFAAADSSLGVSPDSLRLKLYELQCDEFRQHADDVNAIFLKAPAAVFDDRGFLRSDYYDKDPTHGNVAYGRRVVEQILELTGAPR